MHPVLNWLREALRLLGQACMVLALSGQLAASATAPVSDARAAQLRALDAAMVLCQHGHVPGKPRPLVPHRLVDESAILQANGAAQPAILGRAPPVPPPATRLPMRAAAWQQARAPPARFAPASYPRGPPGLA